MRILANALLVLGLAMMAFSRPFSVQLNAPVLCVGALLSVVGIFVRSRVREGIPVMSVTEEDKAQFKEMRREFSWRNVLGQFLGTLAGLFLLVAVLGPFYSRGESYDWRASAIEIAFGLVLVLCARTLLRKSR